MKIARHDTDGKVYVIAEIGNNHEGNFNVACEMIRAAADAGVDAVKFQTIEPEQLVPAAQETRITQLKRFQFSTDQFTELADLATTSNVHFLSTPFSMGAVDALAPLVPAFKIASGDNDFWPLIGKAAATGKPLLVSMGLGQHSHADRLIDFVRKVRSEHAITEDGLALLHCVVSYPTPPEDARLSALASLRRAGVTLGYSDHVTGNRAAELAVAAGARIIEKHFTLDHHYSSFRDHQLSADPAELRALVNAIRSVEVLLGNPAAPLAACESANETAVRRSIAAARPIAKGRQVEWNDLCWLRPRNGFAPGDEARVVGKTALRDIVPGEAINAELLE